MVEPGKNPTRGMRCGLRRQVERLGEIGRDRQHREPRDSRARSSCGLLRQEFAREMSTGT